MPRGRKKAAPVETVKATEVVSVEETVKEEKTAVSAEESAQEAPKKRGRKPGAKNKPKEVKKEVKEMKAVKATGKGLTENIYVEYGSGQYKIEDITNKVKEAWANEGHRVGSIKNLDIYIKPEHNKAYYVINDKNGGSVEL